MQIGHILEFEFANRRCYGFVTTFVARNLYISKSKCKERWTMSIFKYTFKMIFKRTHWRCYFICDRNTLENLPSPNFNRSNPLYENNQKEHHHTVLYEMNCLKVTINTCSYEFILLTRLVVLLRPNVMIFLYTQFGCR